MATVKLLSGKWRWAHAAALAAKSSPPLSIISSDSVESCGLRECSHFCRGCAVCALYACDALSLVCYPLHCGQLWSRVNGINSEWFEEDVRAAAKSGADAVLLPKTESTNDISRLQDLLVKHGAPVAQEICACSPVDLCLGVYVSVCACDHTETVAAIWC